MTLTIQERLSLLRKQMKKADVDAYIVHHSDPHLSEYIPDYWKEREWLSGFTGSAGTLVVTQKNAALWTDSRYFIQAEMQLSGTGIELCKIGMPETPDIQSWLALNLKQNSIVACNGLLISLSNQRTLSENLKAKKFKVRFDTDLVSKIWDDRPPIPQQKVFVHTAEFAKVSVQEKLGRIRKELLVRNATAYLMCALDEICWTFNIRGADISYNPVFLAYAIVDDDKATLYVDENKLTDEVIQFLANEQVSVKPYSKIFDKLAKLKKKDVLVLDPAKVNFSIYSAIPGNTKVIETTGLATQIKARKQPVEVEGINDAMVQDGIAMVEFLYWLEQNVKSGKVIEITVAEKLLEFRSKRKNFISESFGSIVGYADHGAIVHYSATPQTSYTIKPEGFLLVDSGGQYLNGTTDITRTIHLGNPTPQEKRDFTLVLQGMVRLSMAKFPKGTRGSQLDTYARMALWSQGLNYGHGTGHGVGYFLNVHEGPQQIRPENHLPIEPGMVMSNEPGLYRPNAYGIRIENLIVCVEDETNDFGSFLRFDTLTLCPIDIKAIDLDMLTVQEREWLNHYHQLVYFKLSPHLAAEHEKWLKEITKPL
ncbi:MAG: aminopeptidase P family protein [Tenuifilum sp.]|uniref:aminopeptidase P family protein n=1 Tax=Tenuifilum sp. TaxID=2760880 RepID=UPI001B542028|nr:aminopeptidase P family protein [Bacteroidales bacterium]HOK61358.1 aminopeptidase P family protein [Tenuifilum sp.]MBP9029535.1 aminopeptidase P family protein [Bacteroidales bacterium]HOK86073.1 aminopeptidase P family protein [Tenuifilum sp.]HON70833.1 aminopeptidase P family protein [Tenuifilum sp.]